MVAWRYVLMILGIGLFGSAAALAAYDIFLASQLCRLLHRNAPRPHARTVTSSGGLPGSSAGHELR